MDVLISDPSFLHLEGPEGYGVDVLISGPSFLPLEGSRCETDGGQEVGEDTVSLSPGRLGPSGRRQRRGEEGGLDGARESQSPRRVRTVCSIDTKKKKT